MFAAQDLWELVEDGLEEPTDEQAYNNLTQVEKDLLKSNRKKDSKSLFYLYQAVHEIVFPRIATPKRSKDAWDTLQTTYKGMEKVKIAKLQLMRRDFQVICMESDTIDSFFTLLIGFITEMRSHGETLEERRIMEKVFRSLPSRLM